MLRCFAGSHPAKKVAGRQSADFSAHTESADFWICGVRSGTWRMLEESARLKDPSPDLKFKNNTLYNIVYRYSMLGITSNNK